jgi:hypothetical protein
MVKPPCLRSIIYSYRNLLDLPAFQMLFPFKLPTYLNSEGEEKLQVREWLISATPPKFNHLRRDARTEDPPTRPIESLGPVDPSLCRSPGTIGITAR